MSKPPPERRHLATGVADDEWDQLVGAPSSGPDPGRTLGQVGHPVRKPTATRRIVALSLGLILAVACGQAPTATPTAVAVAVAYSGDTLRVIMPAESVFGRFGDPAGDPAALDPHRDWPAPTDTWEFLRCCLARNLLSTNGQSTDKGGSRLHPDVAASLPEISGDGLTWTFRLKRGLHYSPPLQEVEITAQDFIRSFHRFMAPGIEDEYAPTLYNDIVGAPEYRAGAASSISGLESPDPYTLVIRLSAPAGDLAPRLATSAWIPIPASPRDPQARLGVADGHDNGYGRFLVSSGPYMIEGTPELDFSLPPEQQQPLAGLVPGKSLVLVPNPSWDPATDPLRAARPARIELRIVPTLEDAIERIHAATADLMVNSDRPIPVDVAEVVRRDPGLGRLFVHEAGTLLGLTMNTAQPPFDDLHVRRAVNHVVNKVAMIEVQGGPLLRRVAHHVAPDSMEDNLLLDYRPYGSAAGTGDLEAAKAEMAQSRYDTDGDGLCDAEACRGVAAAVGWPEVADAVVVDLARIGIEVDPDYLDGGEAVLDPSFKAAMVIPHGWGRDYLSGSNFFVGQFYSPIALASSGNGSMVGATEEQLVGWGYDPVDVPNVDSRIEGRIPLTGAAQFECWAALDQYMMEQVASFVPVGAGVDPILASRRVIGFAWDELAIAPSYDRIELAPGISPDPVSPGALASNLVSPESSATAATDPDLEGLWETQRLTREQMAATLAAADLEPEGVDLIAESEGFRDYMVYQVEIRDGRWTILSFPDGRPAGVGWSRTYEVVEKGTVTATEPELSCSITYEYEVQDDALRVDLVEDPCDPSGIDELFQTVIFESTPFTRVS